MAEMEVVIIDKFGSREVMKFRKLPIPTPGSNEILLKVKAASINPVDWKIREGQYPGIKSDKLPYVLGRDVSGVVEACGTEINAHQKDHEIYAMPGFDRGAYAEHVIVKANEAAPKPRSIDHVAAMPERRFPPPWSAEETEPCFIVRDHNGQALACVYFDPAITRVRVRRWQCRPR
jgi:NADPH:quinone reductase-like Zn-dependent oxidoreductase